VQRSYLQVLQRPIVTEKNMARVEYRRTYTFEVDQASNKVEIRNAVEKAFNVKVQQVRTINVHGKRKRRGTQMHRQGAMKKAIVTLRDGFKIDIV
jgi:large subunit ribosomal protein L23